MKRATAASAAAVPGSHHSTSGTARSTGSSSLSAFQSMGFCAEDSAASEAGGAPSEARASGVSCGISLSQLGSCVVILERMVRAPTSSLGEATQQGTMLCAST